MRAFFLSVLVLLTAAPALAKVCRKGCPCGNTCISCSKTCRVGSGSAYKGFNWGSSRTRTKTTAEEWKWPEPTKNAVGRELTEPKINDDGTVTVPISDGPMATIRVGLAKEQGVASISVVWPKPKLKGRKSRQKRKQQNLCQEAYVRAAGKLLTPNSVQPLKSVPKKHQGLFIELRWDDMALLIARGEHIDFCGNKVYVFGAFQEYLRGLGSR